MRDGEATEVRGSSTTSVEDAIRQGLATLNKTVHAVQWLWMKEQRVRLREGASPEYQVEMVITFITEAWRPATTRS